MSHKVHTAATQILLHLSFTIDVADHTYVIFILCESLGTFTEINNTVSCVNGKFSSLSLCNIDRKCCTVFIRNTFYKEKLNGETKDDDGGDDDDDDDVICVVTVTYHH
jgi:hypothetical protein